MRTSSSLGMRVARGPSFTVRILPCFIHSQTVDTGTFQRSAKSGIGEPPSLLFLMYLSRNQLDAAGLKESVKAVFKALEKKEGYFFYDYFTWGTST